MTLRKAFERRLGLVWPKTKTAWRSQVNVMTEDALRLLQCRCLSLACGYRFNGSSEFSIDFENIGDKSYRNASWGIDGPGRSLTLRYQYRF